MPLTVSEEITELQFHWLKDTSLSQFKSLRELKTAMFEASIGLVQSYTHLLSADHSTDI